MSSTIQSRSAFAKLGGFLFARQTPMLAADSHKGLLNAFNAWRETRIASRELSALSDRELADIGLTRQEIPAAIRRRM
jgi:uncharacterized protein YjiS (DUF1127 family)